MKTNYYKIAFLLASFVLGVFVISCDCEDEDERNEPANQTVNIQKHPDSLTIKN